MLLCTAQAISWSGVNKHGCYGAKAASGYGMLLQICLSLCKSTESHYSPSYVWI
jgi:hypothetical protein